MSSYSFSHQFYQRWTCAPEPVRAAITQELKDIITLLQTQTPFESFVFSTPDLDTHVDELYDNHDAEQAIAKAIADKQAQADAKAKQEKIKAAEDAKRQEEIASKAQTAQKQPPHKPAATDKKKENNNHPTARQEPSQSTKSDAPDTDSKTDTAQAGIAKTQSNEDATTSGQPQTVHAPERSGEEAQTTHDENHDANVNKAVKTVKAIKDKASTAIKLTLKENQSSAAHQALIRELEVQIDDYLSEQMMLMSENLKSWLHAEVAQQLGEKEALDQPVVNPQ
ncbi:hypothetical protein R0I52_01245 [Psychrobacter sp. CAM01]|uniref:hypothetical protein n=1 Tax=Psychrobacter sp. CAM01 TaxID=3080335 RepID=UPI002935BCBA|nr:hypothetical protein [Psychrobacter sp. CAM01]MDV2859332.1 hypothetical protein [Psychrobacter sp. CAM01]